jgi:hypothetical protein
MRTDGPRGARRRRNALRDLREAEAPRRVADANGPSRGGEGSDLPHPATVSLEGRQFEARETKAWATGDEQH